MGVRAVPRLPGATGRRGGRRPGGAGVASPALAPQAAAAPALGAADPLSRPVSVREAPPLVVLFLITLILPVNLSFELGALRLTPYRVYLLVMMIPLALQLVSGRVGKAILADWLILGYGLWAMLALAINHGGAQGLESGGILIVESLGPYLVARTQFRNLRQLLATVKLLVAIVIAFALYTVPEAVTGINPFQGLEEGGGIGRRMGLYRARGSFAHPILYGVFCASTIGLAWFSLRVAGERPGKRLLRLAAVTLSAGMSVSAGVMAAISIQFLLIVWRAATRTLASRWKLLLALMAVGYFAVDLLSNRSPMTVMLHRLTFSAHTAYNRMIIWDWGFYHNVLVHPVFGIGMNEWARPSWMHSTSMDNFWLVNMVQFGLPAFFLLAAAILSIMIRLGRLKVPQRLADLRMGWIVSMIGLILAACTVHYWHMIYVYFFWFIGIGGAMLRLIRLHESSSPRAAAA